ncbi:MAG TPA: UDP-N-acetylglucosamine 2-epimerase (non-hydrolyzing), partial [Candidatus Babeliales bacterium]|nr:UDP-N-acetylglucosamine 2-epimerase (non-hydrolyzing) [Candidatus Babeliales bacterium]
MLLAKKGPVMLVVGTRPEGIKMAPVYLALKQAGIDVLLCSTTQHDQLLTQALGLFGIKPDFNLGIMRLDQSLFYMTQSILQKTKELFIQVKPSVVVVQGDTTSTMSASLSAFYLNIPVVHLEAGLRTDDIRSPFPEEMNRRFVTTLATYHCAPTQLAYQNLIQQGIDHKKIFCTGNTVVDALRIIKEKISLGYISVRADIKQLIIDAKKNNIRIILFTAHRRESFGEGLARIFSAIKQFCKQNQKVICIYPYHPNPQVMHAIQDARFSDLPNIFIYEPLLYQELVHVLEHADCVITDSGGIQEEAVSLGKKVVVLREKTERMEGVLAGLAVIVGTDPDQ